MDSPSWSLISAKLDYTPSALHNFTVLSMRQDQGGLTPFGLPCRLFGHRMAREPGCQAMGKTLYCNEL